jgi:hypothetical protein
MMMAGTAARSGAGGVSERDARLARLRGRTEITITIYYKYTW